MNSQFARARAGEPAAVAAVVNHLRPRLTRMAGHYARCAQSDADDLLQEAWLGLLDALRELDITIGSPEQYLIQRAKWRLLDAVKRGRLRRCLPLEEALLETLADPDGDAGQAQAMAADFSRHLKTTQVAVLECLLIGMTWREAGDRLGCSSANIAYHVRQIQRQYERWEQRRLFSRSAASGDKSTGGVFQKSRRLPKGGARP